jgi:hypothetical protein
MELFPAASVEQWMLIKRVIDECDYYVVIVAGRYGSTDQDGIGFTEKEFDYAAETGKPIIAFCHANIELLIGAKLEKHDAGKERLLKFTQKVKQRLCRFWKSPAELGSAVKSAIFNELEFNPQPGWIRANSAPDQQMVLKLKQRIADLEERLKKKQWLPNNLPQDAEVLKIPVLAEYDFQGGGPYKATQPQGSHKFDLERTWDEILILFEELLRETTNVKSLRRKLESIAEDEVRPSVQRKMGGESTPVKCTIDEDFFEKVTSTLVAKNLVSIQAEGGATKGDVLRIAKKGAERIAEFRAFRKDGAT